MDSNGDSCGYGMGMGIEMPSPRQPCVTIDLLQFASNKSVNCKKINMNEQIID